MPRPVRMPMLAVLVVALVVVPAAAAAARARTRIDRVETSVVNILNSVRHHYRLSHLGLSRRMTLGAAEHSAVMARTRTITHGDWTERVPAFAGTRSVGEVVGWLHGPAGRRQAHWIVRAWMHSAEHRRVLLSPGFHRLGVGRSADYGLTFFTVDVAR